MTPLYGVRMDGWLGAGLGPSRSRPGKRLDLDRDAHGFVPSFLVAAKTRGFLQSVTITPSILCMPKSGVTNPRGESSLRYGTVRCILSTEEKRQINSPHAGWPVLFVVMFVVWSGPLHVPGGSHVGELPVRWLWNPGERRGNPRWMSSQIGGRCNIGIRGAQCAPSWVCVDPLTALTARYRVEEWSTHFEASCHPVYTCFLSSPPNTCHTPTCHTAGSKKTELPGDRIVGDLIELFPPRIELLANSSKTIKKRKLCRQGADCCKRF